MNLGLKIFELLLTVWVQISWSSSSSISSKCTIIFRDFATAISGNNICLLKLTIVMLAIVLWKRYICQPVAIPNVRVPVRTWISFWCSHWSSKIYSSGKSQAHLKLSSCLNVNLVILAVIDWQEDVFVIFSN